MNLEETFHCRPTCTPKGTHSREDESVQNGRVPESGGPRAPPGSILLQSRPISTRFLNDQMRNSVSKDLVSDLRPLYTAQKEQSKGDLERTWGLSHVAMLAAEGPR